ncbi:Uu.00g035000.m01.CDS01 [Anthostomella pinea]|uniref:Uu.00g035000.m01.CDS01 n=1 Tax=Anthostomella pinea TaxID=933095 RepID=A0AAI8V9N7_9PEZI|nr:Uu.00g035000.m01.CDS01 [Anthostomella pinea]
MQASKPAFGITNAQGVPQMIKYIEATPGASFSFPFIKEHTFKGKCHHLKIMLETDGTVVAETHEPQEARDMRWARLCTTVRLGDEKLGWYGRTFQFGWMPINAMATKVDADKGKCKNLGVLRLRVYKMKRSKQEPQKQVSNLPVVDDVAGNEPKGSALSSNVRFGPATSAPSPLTTFQNVYQDRYIRPFAI